MNTKTITTDHVELWCDADRRAKLLRERPKEATQCPTIGELLEARAEGVQRCRAR